MMLLPEPGQHFRNYKAICEFVGELPKNGSSKISQLRVWRQFFNWTRNGQEWRIVPFSDEIDSPRRTARWKKYIDPGLLCLLYDAMKGRGVNNSSRMFKELLLYNVEAFYHLGLCNDQYKLLSEGKLDCSASLEEQQHFYDESFPRLYQAFIRALNRLHETRTIYYIKTYLAGRVGALELVSEDQRVQIELLKGNLLRTMGYDKESTVIRVGRKEEFYTMLRVIVNNVLQLDSFYSVYRITFTEESLTEMAAMQVLMRKQHEYKEGANRESLKLHLNLFPEPPLRDIAHLVIPQLSALLDN